MKSLEIRFWEKVDKRGPDDCWNWTASCGTAGYGQIGSIGGRGSPVGAHRVAWSLHTGKRIPEKKVIMHSCDNKLCCNPAHLRIGTQAENLADMTRKGRARRGTTHRGEDVTQSKLTGGQVSEIRRLYKTSAFAQVVLADLYNCAQTTISDIVNRRTWLHVA